MSVFNNATKNDTELGKHIWQLQDRIIKFNKHGERRDRLLPSKKPVSDVTFQI